MKLLPICVAIVFQAQGAFAVNGMENVTAQPKPKATPTQNSIRDSSKDTRNSNKSGQLLNLAVGAGNFLQSKMDRAQCPKVQYKCAMAVIHFTMGVANLMQASAQGKTAGQASGSFGATDIGTNGTADPSGGSGYDPNAVAEPEDLKKAKAYVLEMSGTTVAPGSPFAYDPKTQTVLTASGKKLKPEDVSSASSMAAAGISKDVIDAAISSQKAIVAEASKKVSKYLAAGEASAEESGGGGGGSGSDVGSGSADTAAAASYASMPSSSLDLERDPAQLAGMQKNYNGESIGVAGDSIFGMMTRRYKVKESQRSFYDESELLVHK